MMKDQTLKFWISFSDPHVLLERITYKKSIRELSSLDRCPRIVDKSETIHALARKGNEGIGYADPHSCCLCRKVYSCRLRLRVHLKTLHLKTTKFLCDLCPKIYFIKHEIIRHFQNVHLKKRFSCNVCDYRTSVTAHMKSHKMIHAEKVECTICKKLVPSLRNHLLMHRPKERCTVCQKMISKKNINMHIKTHSVKNHKCENCVDCFSTREDLRR